ncbi:NUDIX hydrolase [Chryseolinea lacunae]|uniref:CoA pyrophosphatase n=1 Tax=Chryseolinea lacunae TaxID=2801331 RepID=A0ABS1KXX0_9BACT|nr:CoA pyrophosphatase [Chryseolinea lacunae]MBL0744087.1 CoA pyrophosphatase [Chryseolinea lacunae]
MDWYARLQERLTQPLPGPTAHEPLRAAPIGQPMPDFGHRLPPRPGGVLILLYEEDGVVKFPLTKRQEYPGAHSGQISLPGGKAEPGESAVQTALREAEEEIGTVANTLKVLGTLSPFFVIPSNFMVTPVVALSPAVPVFVRNEYEVARILSCTVDALVREDAVREKEILVAGRVRMMAPHFEIEGEVVWGATAMMLNEFRLVLREVL